MKSDWKTKLAAASMNILPQFFALVMIFIGAWLKFGVPVALVTLGALVWADLWLDSWLETRVK